MLKKKWGVFIFLFLLIEKSAHPWWDQGHQLVAQIAQDATDAHDVPFLSVQSLQMANTLLQVPIASPGSVVLSQNTNTLTKSASWADSIKSYKDNDYNTCHYIDVPVIDLNLVISRPEALARVIQVSRTGKNSIYCTESAIKTLIKPESRPVDKAIALRMIVHIIGDMAQPLHNATHNTDHGGNEKLLNPFFAINTLDGKQAKGFNMHALWDSTLGHFEQYPYNSSEIKNGSFTENEIQSVQKESMQMVHNDQLRMLPVNSIEVNSVSCAQWATDGYLLAHNVVYHNIPFSTEKSPKQGFYINLNQDPSYIEESERYIEPIMYTTGVRLAKLLTAIFDPEHAEKGYVDYVKSLSDL